MILGTNSLPLHQDKAFFLIMQNMTDKGTSLVSKSLPVANINSVNRLFSAQKKKYYVCLNGMKYPLRFHTLLSSFSVLCGFSNSILQLIPFTNILVSNAKSGCLIDK